MPYLELSLAARYPGLGFASFVLNGVINEHVPPRFKKQARALEASLRQDGAFSRHVDANCLIWRNFVIETGESVEGVMPAPAALLDRVRRGGQMPKISKIVDIANFVALSSGLPVGAFDHVEIEGAAYLSTCGPEESMTPLFGDTSERVRPGEIVYRDAVGIFSTYPRDSHRTRIRPSTTHVLFVIDAAPNVPDDSHGKAVTLLAELISEYAPEANVEAFEVQRHRHQ